MSIFKLSEFKRRRRQDGMTIPEVVLAAALIGIIVGAVATIFDTSLDLIESESQDKELIQTARIAINRMSAELRYTDRVLQRLPGGIRFYKVYYDGKTTVKETVTYFLWTGNLYRIGSDGIPEVLAYDVDGFEVGGITLWSKLGQDSEVLFPEIGSGGSFMGIPVYTGMKFDKGFYSDFKSDLRIYFPTSGQLSHRKGTIEFWLRPDYSRSNDAGETKKYLIDTQPGPSAEKIELFYDKGPHELKFKINNSGSLEIKWTPNWMVGELVHIGIVWDSQGEDIGNGETMAVYVNGIKRNDGSPVTAGWTAGSFGTYFSLGKIKDKAAEAAIDNLKVYDCCKTNFNDRDNEDAQGLVTLYLRIKKGEEQVELKNAVDIY